MPLLVMGIMNFAKNFGQFTSETKVTDTCSLVALKVNVMLRLSTDDYRSFTRVLF